MAQRKAIIPGETVWHVANAEKLGFIVDARDYFAAFVDAVEQAHESILILAWDIDSRLRLIRDDAEDQLDFAALLAQVLERRPKLHIHVLCWDFSTIYAMERELLLQLRMDWMIHERLHFSYDSNHPPMGSLHDKLVVIDDNVAFIGGIDLGPRRWDTPRHAPNDERRVSPDGKTYRPFHDVQAVVQGEAARVLGDLARRRWRRATGVRLEAPSRSEEPWPAGVAAAVEDLEVAIVRTRPEYGGRGTMQHTLRFHERLFALAEKLIYVENQFLTSEGIADALVSALRRDHPPEIILVTAKENSGWLETATMGQLRAEFCRRLHEADHRGKLHICSPRISDRVWPNVHTKLTVIDDRWAYVGSANFSNRSMGLDTECGLGLDGTDRVDLHAALRALRRRLLAEHLDVEPDCYAKKEDELGMLGAVDALRGGARTLEHLEVEEEGLSAMLEPVARLADPDRPPRLSDLIDDFF